SGSMRNGWMLTTSGLEWCAQALGAPPVQRTVGQLNGVAMLRQTDAFRKFHERQQDEITIYDTRRFLRVDEYTSARRRTERIQAALNAAAGDEEISALVAYLRSNFPQE